MNSKFYALKVHRDKEHGLERWYCGGIGGAQGTASPLASAELMWSLRMPHASLCTWGGKEEGNRMRLLVSESSLGALGSCVEPSPQIRGEPFSFLSSRSRKGEVYHPRQMNWDSLS